MNILYQHIIVYFFIVTKLAFSMGNQSAKTTFYSF